MTREITSASLQRLLGIGQSVLNDLAKRGIIVRGTKRGSYALEPSVVGYCSHLREIAAGRGGDVRGRAGKAWQPASRSRRSQGRTDARRTVNASDVEKQWTGKMRNSQPHLEHARPRALAAARTERAHHGAMRHADRACG